MMIQDNLDNLPPISIVLNLKLKYLFYQVCTHRVEKPSENWSKGISTKTR